mgnify:CR=1 FL=1
MEKRCFKNLIQLIGVYNGVSYMSVTSSSIFILQKKEDKMSSIPRIISGLYKPHVLGSIANSDLGMSQANYIK